MTWLRLDDDMLDHPKWIRAIRDGGSEALHLWVKLCSWCSRHLTDGVVPADILVELTASWRARDRNRAISALEASQLVTKASQSATKAEPELFVIVGYLERNPSRAETLEKRDRKAKAQRDYADRKKLTGQRPIVVIDDRDLADSAPSRSRPDPVPTRVRDPERARPLEAVARTVTMPDGPPPKSYLDSALMAGVKPEQAKSTWKHYRGAGLPPGGVERLEEWLVQRAVERTVQLARVPAKAHPPPKPGDDLDTTGAATAFQLHYSHRDYAKANLPTWDIEALGREYRASPLNQRPGVDRERDFMRRLVCLKATGKWWPDGELPKAQKPSQPKEVSA